MKSRQSNEQSCLADLMRRFVAHKRALGRRFDVEEKTLRLLDRFLVEQNVPRPDAVTPTLIDAFLATRPRVTPRSYNHLLGTIRRLFDWLVQQDVITDSPVQARPRRQTRRRIPFLFDQLAARRLLNLADSLKDNSQAPRRAVTYRTIFSLLYGLGLRVGEVSQLCCGDVNLQRRMLVIRETKFGKSRLVPFGPRMAAVLTSFIRNRRDRSPDLADDSPLFSFDGNRSIHPCTISQTFHALVPQLALEIPDGVSPPRLHDLRHSFAVGTLVRWYRQGINPADKLLQLSTFMGHVSPVSTAEYLTITSDLLQQAGHRFEQFASRLIGKEDAS